MRQAPFLMVGDGIARASGLSNCMAGELLEFEDGSYGMAQNPRGKQRICRVLFRFRREHQRGTASVKRTGKVVSVPVGEGMIGRVVNALGQPIDGAGPITAAEYRPIESPAPASVREKVLISRCRPVLKRSIPWFRSEEVSES